MLKKVILLIGLLLCSCSLSNTPTSRVEERMSLYQKYDKKFGDDYKLFGTLDSKYQDLVKKQYMNMNYEIKDELIDGDEAVVSLEIEVIDYSDYVVGGTIYNDNYYDDIFNKMKNEKKKIIYTIEINLYKNSNGNWVIKPLLNEVKYKLLGIYS